MRALIALLCTTLLAACAGLPAKRKPLPVATVTPTADAVALPLFRLAPADFGAEVTLAQRLEFEYGAGMDRGDARSGNLDAVLQIDARHVRIAALVLGRRVLGIDWDGMEFTTQRDPRLPAQVDAARVLRDVQFAFWPLPALRTALPAGWSIQDDTGSRVLLLEGTPRMIAHYTGLPHWVGTTRLENRVEGYQLVIESAPAPQ